MGILQHHAERAAQIILFDLPDIDAVVADFTIRHLVETIDQVGNGRFSGARRADKGNLLPGLCVKGYVLQYGFSPIITKGHIKKTNIAGERFIGDSAILVRMLPGPKSGMLCTLHIRSIFLSLRINERHIPLILLRL